MPIPKDKKGLTAKQTKFVKAYVKGRLTDPTPPISDAAMAVYDIDKTDPAKAQNTANQIAVENLQKPTIRQAIENAMIKHGITIDSATKPIADGLSATRSVYSGEEVYESVDHSTRLKASAMALKLLGADQGKQESTTNYNFTQVNNDMRNKYND